MTSQVILFSHGRTGCHLLERMLFSQQPNSKTVWHPAVRGRQAQISMMQEDSVAANIPSELRDQYVEIVQQGIEQWSETLRQATEEKQTVLVHEHPQFLLSPDSALSFVQTRRANPSLITNTSKSNFTLAPTSLLCHPGTVAIITTRHPALTVPAAYHALKTLERFGGDGTPTSENDANIVLISNAGWQREIYDFYVANGCDAVVVEAEEYMSSPEYTRQLAKRVGLNPDACTFEWKAATEEEKAKMPPVYVQLQETLLNSTGLVASKVRKNVNVDVEEQKWREKYGTEAAVYIRRIVDQVMPHYEYLLDHTFRAT